MTTNQTEKSRALVNRYFAAVNARDIDALTDLVAEGLVNHAALPEAQGRNGMRNIFEKLGVETWASFHEKALTKGATAAKLAGTITYRQERRSKSGNRFAFVGFSEPTGQFETIVFSDLLATARDLLEPGSAVIVRVEADIDGDEVRLRLHDVQVLDKASAAVQSGLIIFIKDEAPVASIAQRLKNGGRAPVKLIVQTPTGREVDITLGNKFTVTPQIKGAIKAIPGVIDVQDF